MVGRILKPFRFFQIFGQKSDGEIRYLAQKKRDANVVGFANISLIVIVYV